MTGFWNHWQDIDIDAAFVIYRQSVERTYSYLLEYIPNDETSGSGRFVLGILLSRTFSSLHWLSTRRQLFCFIRKVVMD